MNQAVKSALAKYQGKTEKNAVPGGKLNRAVLCLTVIAVAISAFAVCVKYDILYADRAWNALSSISVGSVTVGQIAEKISNKIHTVFSKDENKTSPVNQTGESGKLEITQTMSSVSAQYLDYVKRQLYVTAPLSGEITCGFGNRTHPVTGKESFHTGLDIAAEEGTEVAAYQDGKVTDVGKNDNYGNYILLTHNNKQTFYGHLSAVDVKKGQTVLCGDRIGKVGSTGLSTGPHLHFEIRINGECVNPADYINVSI